MAVCRDAGVGWLQGFGRALGDGSVCGNHGVEGIRVALGWYKGTRVGWAGMVCVCGAEGLCGVAVVGGWLEWRDDEARMLKLVGRWWMCGG